MNSWLPLLALAGCTEAPAPQTGPPPALVELAVAESGSLSDRWEVPGEVRALRGAELAAGAEGQVTRVAVREGDWVEAGDLLLQVDPDLAAARRDAARASAAEGLATLERARRELDRLQRVDRNVLSASEFDLAEVEVARLDARHQSLDAAARQAAVELARHRVSAPFAGAVTSRRVDPGDWVARGQHVLSLVSVADTDIRVDVSPRLAAAVDVGDPVQLRGAGQAEGVVAGVVPALDPEARTALVRVTPVERTAWLVPGATVTVAFDVDVAQPDAVLVPRDALVLGPVQTRVVRSVDGSADPVVVEVLASTADMALVTGLQAGDTVVVRGNERLRPGQALRVQEQE